MKNGIEITEFNAKFWAIFEILDFKGSQLYYPRSRGGNFGDWLKGCASRLLSMAWVTKTNELLVYLQGGLETTNLNQMHNDIYFDSRGGAPNQNL